MGAAQWRISPVLPSSGGDFLADARVWDVTELRYIGADLWWSSSSDDMMLHKRECSRALDELVR